MAFLPLVCRVTSGEDAAMTIEILLFDGFDDLDAFGPFEVFRTAGRDVRYVTVEPAERVTSSHGTTVFPHGTVGDPDLLVVPGGGWNDREGGGAYREAKRGVIGATLTARHASGRRIASVCTGAMLLAEAGLLTGRRAITHHTAIEDLRAAGADVAEDARYVDEGDIVTAGGVTSGIDMALYLLGEDADAVRREIEWGPARPAGSLG